MIFQEIYLAIGDMYLCVCVCVCIHTHTYTWGFPSGLNGKEFACDSGVTGDSGSIPGSGRSPGKGHINLLQYSCPENSTDRGASGLQSRGLERVRHDCNNLAHVHIQVRSKAVLGRM